jgi:hypothetical protein
MSREKRIEKAQALSAGYAASTVTASRRTRDEKVAAGVQRDDRMERVLALRASDRVAFAVAVSGLGMRRAFYENAKAAAERLEGDDDAA